VTVRVGLCVCVCVCGCVSACLVVRKPIVAKVMFGY
jgi:hypothetical protein